jgi:G3E family GTPase
MTDPYEDLDELYRELTRSVPSKDRRVRVADWGEEEYIHLHGSIDSFNVEKEASSDEEMLEALLAQTGQLSKYRKRRAKDKAKGQTDMKWVQYHAVQKIMTGESELTGKPLRGSKRTKAIPYQPQSKDVFEKEAVHRIFAVTKEKKQDKADHYNGFPVESFDRFYGAYKTYKSRVKSSTQEPLEKPPL